MANNRDLAMISLNNDPKFDGQKTCTTSAEDWLRAMVTKARCAEFTDQQAIDYAMRHLEGTAAEYFYTVLRQWKPSEAENIMKEWAKWQEEFRKSFFKEVSTADAVIDWNNLKQSHQEDAVSFLHRVSASVANFFNRTCGTLKGDDTRTSKKFELARSEAAKFTQLKEGWATKAVAGLEEAQAIDVRLKDIPEPQAAQDAYNAYMDDMCRMAAESGNTMMEGVYITLQSQLTAALTLKTMHMGLKYQKCKEVVFQAMMKEHINLTEVARALRSTEQDVESQRAQVAHRFPRNGNGQDVESQRSQVAHRLPRNGNGHHKGNRINALEDDEYEVDSDEPDQEIMAVLPSSDVNIEKIVQAVAAVMSKKQQQAGSDFQGTCYHCKKKGHIKARCPKWKKDKASATAERQSEN